MDRGKGHSSSSLVVEDLMEVDPPAFAISEDHQKRKKKTMNELIASWKAQPDVHTHIFSYVELANATAYFTSAHIASEDGYDKFYNALLREKQVLIRSFKRTSFFFPHWWDYNSVVTRDMVVGTRLSSHGNNSLNLIGFGPGAQVFEYQGDVKFLSNSLQRERNELLPWRNRLSIARDIANAIVILHTSFSTPVILREMKPTHILIDKFGVAKLFDFSLCLEIPEGESQVEDDGLGRLGFVDPQNSATGVVTEKSDVFSFGVFLLVLLTGQKAWDDGPEKKGYLYKWIGESVKKGYLKKIVGYLYKWIGESVKKGYLKKIVDRRIMEENVVEREHEFQAIASLALRCVRERREERPRMIDVAAELARIQSGT